MVILVSHNAITMKQPLKILLVTMISNVLNLVKERSPVTILANMNAIDAKSIISHVKLKYRQNPKLVYIPTNMNVIR